MASQDLCVALATTTPMVSPRSIGNLTTQSTLMKMSPKQWMTLQELLSLTAQMIGLADLLKLIRARCSKL